MNYSDIKQEFKMFSDKFDQWGEAMSLHFDVAAELFARGDDIPSQWVYSAGLAVDPRESDTYFAPMVADCPSDDQTRLGNLLSRYTRRLEAAGQSY